eukprot:scaffold121357_cov60-Attheya_sp.AAC.2
MQPIARSSAVVSTGIRQTTASSTGKTPTSPTTPPGTLAARLTGTSRRSRRWVTRKIKMRDDGADVAQAIRDGNGASGYVLLGSSRHLRIEGSLVVPGCSLTMSAYRSELGGLYGIVCVLEDLCIQYTITDGHVTIGCDGQEALWQALGSLSSISPSASDFDLVAAIRRKIQALPIRTSMKWIKGHQDSLPGEAVTRLIWARLNISMDLLAKQRRALHDRRANPDDLHHSIEGEPWQLILDGKTVSKNFKDRLFQHCATPALMAYWKT